MSNVDRSYPGALASARGDTFLTQMNNDRNTVYDHAEALQAQHEQLATEYVGKGTMPGNTALLTIDDPVAGRVYCPVGYAAVIGAAVETAEAISQAYVADAVSHVFLVLGTDGALSLRCSASATEADNELWIADVDDTGVTALDNDPTGKAYATIANSKLAAPNAYFTVPVAFKDLAAESDDLREFQMPFAATLVEVSASCQAASGTTATVDVLEAGSTVLSAPIDVKTGAGTPQVAAPADGAIADNAVVGVKLSQTGAGATSGGFAVLTFKVAHVA